MSFVVTYFSERIPYSRTIMLEGKSEEAVIEIMERHINDALEFNYFLKDINYFESVMVLIFESNPK